MTPPSRPSIRVGVIDEHEIFRRGVVACLQDEIGIQVVADIATGPVAVPLDVAVTSPQAAVVQSLACPVLVCASSPTVAAPPDAANDVRGVLPCATLTGGQLVGAVRAAAAGLTVRVDPPNGRDPLDARSLVVLRLLAEGADTQQISDVLACSSRTVKSVISGLEQALRARNRAQAVAVGIRDGLI